MSSTTSGLAEAECKEFLSSSGLESAIIDRVDLIARIDVKDREYLASLPSILQDAKATFKAAIAAITVGGEETFEPD